MKPVNNNNSGQTQINDGQNFDSSTNDLHTSSTVNTNNNNANNTHTNDYLGNQNSTQNANNLENFPYQQQTERTLPPDGVESIANIDDNEKVEHANTPSQTEKISNVEIIDNEKAPQPQQQITSVHDHDGNLNTGSNTEQSKPKVNDLRTGQEPLHNVSENADSLTFYADEEETEFIERIEQQHGY